MQISTVIYFLIWAGIFALMMRFGCGAHVMGHGHRHDESAGERGHTPENSASLNPPERDVDPVCGMSIRTAEAKSAVYAGRAYYFCSQTCREKFEAAPSNYLKAQGLGSMPEEHHHGSCC